MWTFLKGMSLHWAGVIAIVILFLALMAYVAKVVKRIAKRIAALIADLFKGLWKGSVDLSTDIITLWHDVLVFDTLRQRQKMAKELKRCALERDPGSLRKLERAARSPYSFKRSYALNALGRLDWRASEDVGKAVKIQVKGLASRDPYVREAAAHALYRMGNHAAPAQSALVEILRAHRSEGAARYAVLALGRMRDLTKEALDELKATVVARNSCAAAEAAQLLKDRRPTHAGGPG